MKTAIPALFAWFFALCPLTAQDTPEPEPRFDLELPGVRVSEACQNVAALVEDLTAEPINIVVSKEASDIELPSMQLRQITFDQFVSFINRIGGARPVGQDDPFSSGAVPDDAIPRSGPIFGMDESDGIWYFWARVESAAPKQPKVELLTRIFPLEGDVEAVLGLIEEALTESRRHRDTPEPALKFHEPSGTLIVTGDERDLALIEEVTMVMEIRESKRREARAGIREMERELEQLLQTHTPEHPAVVELKQRLERALAALERKE